MVTAGYTATLTASSPRRPRGAHPAAPDPMVRGVRTADLCLGPDRGRPTRRRVALPRAAVPAAASRAAAKGHAAARQLAAARAAPRRVAFGGENYDGQAHLRGLGRPGRRRAPHAAAPLRLVIGVPPDAPSSGRRGKIRRRSPLAEAAGFPRRLLPSSGRERSIRSPLRRVPNTERRGYGPGAPLYIWRQP